MYALDSTPIAIAILATGDAACFAIVLILLVIVSAAVLFAAGKRRRNVSRSSDARSDFGPTLFGNPVFFDSTADGGAFDPHRRQQAAPDDFGHASPAVHDQQHSTSQPFDAGGNDAGSSDAGSSDDSGGGCDSGGGDSGSSSDSGGGGSSGD